MKRSIPVPTAKPLHRGDIYYIKDTETTIGSEQNAGRPAIIVSNDLNNTYSQIVEIVYLTTQHKKPLPTHVRVMETGRPSTALCEQVHSVDRARLGSFVCSLKEDTMSDISGALMVSMELSSKLLANTFLKAWVQAYENGRLKVEGDKDDIADTLSEILAKLDAQASLDVTNTPEYLRLEAERDVYRNLYKESLENR